MKKKLIALGLACALPMSNCSFNICSALCSTDSTYYYKATNPQEEKIQQLKKTIDDLKKDNELQQLKEQVKHLKKELKQKNCKSSTKNSVWQRAKQFLKNGFGLTLGASALITIFTATLFAGTAIYDCATDNKCHFDDKSFFEKFNSATLKDSFNKAKDFALDILRKINIVSIQVESDDL